MIVKENGEVVTDEKLVQEEIRKFYKELYETVPDQIDINADFFRHITRIDPAEAAALTEDLTLDELTATLRTCNDSSPGPDGIPYSYMKLLWSSFGKILCKAWEYSLENNNLPPSHKASYLKLIPKVGKDLKTICAAWSA